MDAINPQFTIAPEPDLLAPLDEVSGKLFDQIQLLVGIESLFQSEIIAPGEIAGINQFGGPGDRLASILTILRREMEAARDQLESAHSDLFLQRNVSTSTISGSVEPKDWLQRHPRLAATIRIWTASLDAYHEAQRAIADLSTSDPQYDVRIDSLTNNVTAALDKLVAAPSPGLRAFRKKVAIVVRDGTMGNEDVPAMILEDLDRLINATENEPWLVDTVTSAEPCACPADAPVTIVAGEA